MSIISAPIGKSKSKSIGLTGITIPRGAIFTILSRAEADTMLQRYCENTLGQ